MAASDFTGRVALVVGGGNPVGAAVARSLAARGVSVVVTGPDEHALAMVVCEIANAAGKARHLVGDLADPAHPLAALEKTRASFGPPSIIVAVAGPSSFAASVASAAGTVTTIVLVGDEAVEGEAAALAAAGIACHAVVAGRSTEAAVSPEDAAEVVVLACTRPARALSGSVLRLRGAVAS